MKKKSGNSAGRFLELRPLYAGSYTAILYGLAVAISGYVRGNPFVFSVGELLLYGGLLYHARKRHLFSRRMRWLALEVYAGLSFLWMTLHILRTQVWRWHPIAFAFMPLVMIGTYTMAFVGKARFTENTDRGLTSRINMKQIALLVAIAAMWVLLNTYAFPKMGIMT